jgi:hypothetical protein
MNAHKHVFKHPLDFESRAWLKYRALLVTVKGLGVDVDLVLDEEQRKVLAVRWGRCSTKDQKLLENYLSWVDKMENGRRGRR